MKPLHLKNNWFKVTLVPFLPFAIYAIIRMANFLFIVKNVRYLRITTSHGIIEQKNIGLIKCIDSEWKIRAD